MSLYNKDVYFPQTKLLCLVYFLYKAVIFFSVLSKRRGYCFEIDVRGLCLYMYTLICMSLFLFFFRPVFCIKKFPAHIKHGGMFSILCFISFADFYKIAPPNQ